MKNELKEIHKQNTKQWNELYSGHHGIQYPHEQLVIYVSYLRQLGINSQKPKALEIGFGSIADMDMLYKKGYEVSGLEVSENAVLNGIKKCKELEISLDLNVWSPPQFPYSDDHFDLFCSSNAIHYNLDQEAILSEIYRVLNGNGQLYTTYLAPGHKFIEHSEVYDENMIKFTNSHEVPNMRNMVMCYFDSADKIEKLYNKFFQNVHVTRLEYNILNNPNVYWIVTASKK